MPPNPFEPPQEVNVAAASPPLQVLLPWPTLGYWLLAFFLPAMMMLAATGDHVAGLHWLDWPGSGRFVYAVPLISLGLCWLIALSGKASAGTKFGWFVFTPIAVALQCFVLLIVFGFLFLALDGPKGTQ